MRKCDNLPHHSCQCYICYWFSEYTRFLCFLESVWREDSDTKLKLHNRKISLYKSMTHTKNIHLCTIYDRSSLENDSQILTAVAFYEDFILFTKSLESSTIYREQFNSQRFSIFGYSTLNLVYRTDMC